VGGASDSTAPRHRPPRPHVVVVGGGIAGLTAAYALSREGATGPRVTLFETSAVLGGKLRVGQVAGLPVDEGAEAILARRPEGTELARAVGLGAELVHPATTAAAVWTRGALRPLPAGHVMGVPTDLRALADSGVLSPGGLARVSLDALLLRTPVDGDIAVGRYVAARLGREVVDRLVEPLLGGVYAGHADNLSLAATVPQLAEIAARERSLLAGARRVRAARPPDSSPVFAGVSGGVGRLAAAVSAAARSRGAQLRTGVTVRGLRRTPTGWQLTVGPASAREEMPADAVILALPAAPAARLLADVAPAAASELAGVAYASVAIVMTAWPTAAFPRPLTGSGFLVPPVDGRVVKAATYSSRKWGWLAAADPGVVVVRCSVGRLGDEADLQRDDAELVSLATADLAAATGVRGRPVDARVTRWGGSLPQYAVGHLDRVARIRAAVAAVPGLAVCGAAYDGIGIPACVASGRAAAAQVLRRPAGRGE